MDGGCSTRRRRNGITVFEHALDVEGDRFPHRLDARFDDVTSCGHAGKVRAVGRTVRRAVSFDDDGVVGMTPACRGRARGRRAACRPADRGAGHEGVRRSPRSARCLAWLVPPSARSGGNGSHPGCRPAWCPRARQPCRSGDGPVRPQSAWCHGCSMDRGGTGMSDCQALPPRQRPADPGVSRGRRWERRGDRRRDRAGRRLRRDQRFP